MAITWTDITNGEDGIDIRNKLNIFNSASTTQTNTNETNIATNAANISTNTTDIETNAIDIASNDVDIADLYATKVDIVSLILSAASYVTQNPVGLDNPLIINYGAAQSNAFVSLAADGTLTFLQTGNYQIHLKATYGRSSSVGESIIMGRFTLNGSALGETLATKMSAAAQSSPYHELGIGAFTAGDILVLEMYRDSAGVDDGGLYTIPATLAGWTDSPSAILEIYKM